MATAMRVVTESDFQLLQRLKGSKGQVNKLKLSKTTTTACQDERPVPKVADRKTRLVSLIAQMGLPTERLKWKAWKLAMALLDMKTFNWNPEGEISFNGTTRPRSNIMDLVKNFVLLDQSKIPVSNPKQMPGADFFFDALNQLKMKSIVSVQMRKRLNKM